ncbi:MAG: choice-of-anchor Q domain-containing protein [Chloroflexota bacterium]
MRNNVFAGNTAEGTTCASRGGGLYLSLDTNGYLVGNTFHDNSADEGGGVYLTDLTTAGLYNNIVYANSAPSGADVYFDGVTYRIGYHNDCSDVNRSWTDAAGNIDVAPVFVDPGTGNYRLDSGSPCIDAGTAAVPDPPGLPDYDIEGYPRTIGTAPDIGAYEYVGLVLQGDVNGDGRVNVGDITKLERIMLMLDPVTPGADVNGDGRLNAADITKIERIMLQLD